MSSPGRPGAPAQPPWLLLILSAVAVVLLAAAVAVVHRFESGSGDAPSRTPSGAEVLATKDGGTGAKRRTVAAGTVTKDADFAFKVTRVTSPGRTLGSGAARVTADGRFVVVRIAVKNLGDTPRPLLPTIQRLHDRAGAVYVADPNVPSKLSRRLWTDVPAGRAVAGIMVFDIPAKARIASLELHGSGMSAGIDVKLGKN